MIINSYRYKVSKAPDDYISYYKFNQNGNDETGNNNATVSGSTYVNDKDGNPLSAINFQSGADLVTKDPMILLNSQKLSLSFWINMDASQASGGPQIFRFDNPSDANQLFLITTAATSLNCFYRSSASDFRNIQAQGIDTLYGAGWTHIGVVIDTTEATDTDKIKYYIDGVHKPSTVATQSGDILNAQYSLKMSINTATFMQGSFDENKMFDRPLSSEEMAALAAL